MRTKIATTLVLIAALTIAALTIAPRGGEAGGATFVVDTDNPFTSNLCTPSPGDCNFAGAIGKSNSTAGKDTITFGLPGAGVQILIPLSPLPEITDPVDIDGYTQTGAAENNAQLGSNAAITVVLTGAEILTPDTDGLLISAGNSSVRGISIQEFNRDGIHITGGGGNVIQGNFIGINTFGTADVGNGMYGVLIESSSNNTVGGLDPADRNVVSGNDKAGIVVLVNPDPANNNTIQGNIVGTKADGTGNLGNTESGIDVIQGHDNVIGGPNPGFSTVGCTGPCNLVVSSVSQFGTGEAINLFGDDARGNVVQGNYLGTDVTGLISNPMGGRVLSLGNGAPDNTIGGSGPGEGNIIGHGQLAMDVAGATGTVIQGNLFNTDRTGNTVLEPTFEGVLLRGSDNQIGGSAAGEGNVFGGYYFQAINVSRQIPVGGNHIEGNFIGVSPTGADIGNAIGVQLANNAVGNFVGGENPGAGNEIANNTGAGITVEGTAADNSIRGNSIHDNAGLGIDIGADSVTSNDNDDPDTGPNNVQNYPLLADAFSGSVHVVGTLNSEASTTYTIDVYVSASCDPSGFGEGATYLGHFSVATNANGDATLDGFLSGSAPVGDSMTVTATDPNGNTSEFSACHDIEPLPITPTPTPSPTPSPTPTGSPSANLIQGDFNCNGIVDEDDFTFMIQYFAGLNDGTQPDPCPDLGEAVPAAVSFLWGDVDCQNGLNPLDALHVLAYKAGIGFAIAGCTPIGSPLT